jgi:quercetin dioxygenase-like cupin family protein
MHFAKRSSEIAYGPHPVFQNQSQGYAVAPLVDHNAGSVHTGTSLNLLAPGGVIAPHVHSYEESFYILEGHAVLGIGDRAYLLEPGDYGVAKVGTEHSWRNTGSTLFRWLQMAAPQPKPPGRERDTFFPNGKTAPHTAEPIDFKNLSGDLLGHFDASQVPPAGQRTEALAGAPGVFLKWMIDEKFGARHHRLLFIEYQPGVGIPLHDHTFEESYYMLSGEIEAVMDGEKYTGKPGDVFWTSVGCVHSFTNTGGGPVRWIETFAPQPPAENVFRFMAEWEKKAKELEG